MSFSDTEISSIQQAALSFPIGTEISVARIVNGEPFYFGCSHSESGLTEVENNNAVFEIGSVTKVMTSTVLAQLIVDGKIQIDQTIGSFLPSIKDDIAAITFRELATHTSGLPRLPPGILWQSLFKGTDNPYQSYTEDRLLTDLTENVKIKTKGKMRYSNFGVGLLGYVLALASGCSYDELLTEYIFSPLGMSSSTTNRELVKNKLVQGLNTKGKPTNYWDLGALEGAGAVLSSTRDLVKFVSANFAIDNKVMNYQRTIAFENKSSCMALGWTVAYRKENNQQIYFHDGGTGGFSSAVLVDVEAKDAFIVLSNVSGLHKLKGSKITNLAFSSSVGRGSK